MMMIMIYRGDGKEGRETYAYFVYPPCHAANVIWLKAGWNPELAAFSLLLFQENDPGKCT